MALSQCFFCFGSLSPASALISASPLPHPNSTTASFSTQFHSTRLHLTTRPAVETHAVNGGAAAARVFVVSDLHTDYSENMSWLKSLPKQNGGQNVLLVSGDVAETLQNFIETMSILTDKFDRVFFVSGNHDLWLRRDKIDYACKDYHVCRWPDELKNGETSLALYFDSLNDENSGLVEDILKKCKHIISFSHFVPRYVQAPLASPRERKRRMNGGEDWLPFCIYSSGSFADRLSPCYWSDYYSVNPRTPDVNQLAPWVARSYSKSG